MNISKRHHYIPQFFLKGFTDTKGELSIFDLKTNRFWKNKASTKQVFFEDSRNLFEINGETTDLVEQLYQRLDGDYSQIHKKILASNSSTHQNLSSKELRYLIVFIGLIYWRVPVHDSEVRTCIQSLTKKELNILVTDFLTGDEASPKEYSQLMTEAIFIESYRMIKPILDYIKVGTEIDIEDWCLFYANSDAHHITSDNPVIVRDKTNSNIFMNDIIFRVSKETILCNAVRRDIKEIPPDIIINIDLLIILQSEKFIAGPNQEYIQHLTRLAQQTFESKEQVETLKSEIFTFFESGYNYNSVIL